jgi:glutamate transport system permease protein
MSSQSNVLFDAPGPKARRRNNVFTLLAATAILGVASFVYSKFDEKGQWSGRLWRHFLHASTWTEFIIPGLAATLKVAALGAVFALVFGAAFGLARLSDHRWIRRPAGAVVEIFRAIPLLLLIFFIAYLTPTLFGSGDYTLVALVGGLTLYNGSVLAEVLRAGVLAVPRGQSEAAYAIGLRKTGVMSLVLLPLAVTVMMPAIVSQLVVLLKDTALGYIIGYQDLLSYGFQILPANYFGTRVSSAIVIALIYVGLNMTLGALASWLERRSRTTTIGADTGIDLKRRAGLSPMRTPAHRPRGTRRRPVQECCSEPTRRDVPRLPLRRAP